MGVEVGRVEVEVRVGVEVEVRVGVEVEVGVWVGVKVGVGVEVGGMERGSFNALHCITLPLVSSTPSTSSGDPAAE